MIDTFLVSYTYASDDNKSLLLVTMRHNEELTIVNALQGQDADDLYKKLKGVK